MPNTFHAKVGDTWSRAVTAVTLAFALVALQLLRELPRLRGRRLAGVVHANAGRASVLAADMGGALWLDKLDMMDLAGLCDPEFARLLGKPEPFADAALARKPTFIEFHGDIARLCGLPDSIEFRRDYLPIAEQEDEYATKATGRPIHTGFYVRRELAPDPKVLDRWRQSLR